MEIDELHDMIEDDSEINEDAIHHEIVKIPVLHAKYMRLYTHEFDELKQANYLVAKIKRDRSNYYLGRASDETYAKEKLNIKILKTELDVFLAADDKLGQAELILARQKVKVDVIEKFLQSLNNRGYALRTALDFIKFKAGER